MLRSVDSYTKNSSALMRFRYIVWSASVGDTLDWTSVAIGLARAQDTADDDCDFWSL